MVQIHNFLNEVHITIDFAPSSANRHQGSWQEILKWEKEYHCECQDIGLIESCSLSFAGLLKFMGKPSQLSPKGIQSLSYLSLVLYHNLWWGEAF
jgi:hypothetical protein